MPSAASREKIYDRSDAATAADSPKADVTKPTPEETPPAEKKDGKPDSEEPKAGKEPVEKGEKGKEGKPEGEPDKRLRDTQSAFHRSQEDLKKERAARADLEKKVALYEKYVDPEKLAAHDKEQEEKDLDQPLTKRELRDKEQREAAERKAADEKRAVDEYTEKFVKENPHVAPYVESGEAKGVYEKAALRIWEENPGITQVELMEQAGKFVADHFRKADEAKRAQVAQELTTRRESLSQGRTPPSGGTPAGGGDDADPGDDPGAEVARRQQVRSRILRPTL